MRYPVQRELGEAEVAAHSLKSRRLAGRAARSGVIVAVAAVAGCSYAPDWANPLAWYDSALGEPAPAAAELPVPGAEQAYPRLGSVPERPRPPTGSAARQRALEGLQADRAVALARREQRHPERP